MLGNYSRSKGLAGTSPFSKICFRSVAGMLAALSMKISVSFPLSLVIWVTTILSASSRLLALIIVPCGILYYVAICWVLSFCEKPAVWPVVWSAELVVPSGVWRPQALSLHSMESVIACLGPWPWFAVVVVLAASYCLCSVQQRLRLCLLVKRHSCIQRSLVFPSLHSLRRREISLWSLRSHYGHSLAMAFSLHFWKAPFHWSWFMHIYFLWMWTWAWAWAWAWT